MAKNSDPDKYVFRGYGIGFNSRLDFPLFDGSMGVIIFGVNMSSSVHIDNKTKDIWILLDQHKD